MDIMNSLAGILAWYHTRETMAFSARGRNSCKNLSFSEISRISMNQLEKDHVSRGSPTNGEAD